VEEVAAIWKEARDFYERTLALWRNLRAQDPETERRVEDYRETLRQLLATVSEHYAFHAE
jgi:hypothetical protein